MAKSAAVEGLVRSGAASSIVSKVPIGGALFSAFGGLGGKKKRVAAGIKLISPATGRTIVTGSGEVKKSTLSFGGGNDWTARSEEHTSELQSLMSISYAVFCLQKKQRSYFRTRSY